MASTACLKVLNSPSWESSKVLQLHLSKTEPTPTMIIFNHSRPHWNSVASKDNLLSTHSCVIDQTVSWVFSGASLAIPCHVSRVCWKAPLNCQLAHMVGSQCHLLLAEIPLWLWTGAAKTIFHVTCTSQSIAVGSKEHYPQREHSRRSSQAL